MDVLKNYASFVIVVGCLIYLAYRFFWGHSSPRVEGPSTKEDQQLADEQIAASERRARCSRGKHVGYRRDIHRGYCPSCGAAVPPDIT